MIDPDNSPFTVDASEIPYRREHPPVAELVRQIEAMGHMRKTHRKTQRFLQRFGVDI